MRGVFSQAQLGELAGCTLLRRMADGDLPHAPIYRTFGFRLVHVEIGCVAVAGTPSKRFYNPIGSVHGGYISALLDTCMGCAVHSGLPAGQTYTTVDITVKYLHALRHDSGEVTAHGSVIHAGRRIATAEARLIDAAGKLYARGLSTSAIIQVDSKSGAAAAGLRPRPSDSARLDRASE
jgi:uncharacterized protein (TIGR00369 family)